MVDLIGKIVEVGTAETLYYGTLIEVNEDEVHLQTDSGWIVVPLEKVAFVKEKEPD